MQVIVIMDRLREERNPQNKNHANKIKKGFHYVKPPANSLLGIFMLSSADIHPE